jgi:cyclophilin family peptidyl-prolyl cis-trans isomerase
MMKKSRLVRRKQSFSRVSRSGACARNGRRATFELLESRLVLSPTVAAIPNQAVSASTPYMIDLTGSGATGLTYQVQSSNASLFAVSMLTSNDQVLTLNVNHTSSGSGDATFSGPMAFQLLDAIAPNTVTRIKSVANGGGYNNKTFYRIAENSTTDIFAIQGGNQASVGATAEIDKDLQFTTAGILAIANSGGTTTDGDDFFITTEAASWLNSGYTIFGMQTSGATIRSDIAGVAATATSGTGTPISPVTITSASVASDPLDGVMLLNVKAGATGTATITVTATDTLGNKTTQTFTVTAGPPVVTGVTSTATGSHGIGDSIPITVNFSEPVTVNTSGGTPQLVLNAGSGAVAAYSSGSGGSALTFTYTVAAGQNASPLDYTSAGLNLNGGTIKDSAGNAAVASSLATGGADGLAAANISVVTPPIVTAVTTSPATVTQANVGSDGFAVTLTFNKPMQASPAPTITFSGLTGTLSLDTAASKSKWTDSTHYVATYNVTNGAVPQTSVGVNVTGAQDSASNAQTAYAGSNNFSVDTLDPAVVSITPNLTTVATANTGTGAFTLTVVYSTAMDTASSAQPTISFPTSGKNPVTGGTLTFNSGTWTNSTTYVASYNVANQGLTMSSIDVGVQGAMDSSAAHTQVASTQSGVFSINMATSTLAGAVTLGSTKLGIGGVTVRLLSSSTEVSGKSPVQTAADGSYKFTSLAQGSYTIELVESPDYRTWSASVTGSSPSGTTSGTDEIQVTLGAGVNGTGYNFSAKGVQPAMISARMFLASAPPLVRMVQSMHTAPTVNLSGSSSGTTFAATYQAGGSAAAIASSSATITSPGSTTLAWLKATITNPKDGTSEVLAATIPSGTSITSAYAGNVLTLSGVADLSVYQTILRSITYSDAKSPPTAGARTITVVVNDGTASSTAATATMTVQAAGTASAAADFALAHATNWLQS